MKDKLVKGFINGEWLEAASGATLEVINPATQEVIARVADMGIDETEQAIEAATEAFTTWKTTTAAQRAKLLRRWYDLLMENQAELAALLTTEQGKPITEAQGEIAYGASYIEWYAEEARRMYGDVIPAQEADKRISVIRQPIGVVGIITPWNFPNAMLARKIAPALAAGCTVVVKPAAQTPLSALALAFYADKAGIPKGVINIIPSTKAAEVGKLLTTHPLVRKISFTGSTKVGKILMQQSASTLKRLSLELGGNAPFIVFDDANLEEAVKGAILSKFRNAGQTCVCANRLYVQRSVYDTFIKQFSVAVKSLLVGDGLDKNTAIGPLIDENALKKVERLLADALHQGATISVGGRRHSLGGLFFEPTVLVNVTAEMACMNEEIFGPMATIQVFDTEEEVLKLANATSVGLAAYFYSDNIKRVVRVSEALETGMVGINTGIISTAVAPFGGIKESGFGREGSKYGLEDYTQLKYLCSGGH